MLLGTRYHDWGPTSQAVRDAFVGAYCDRAPLTGAEHAELARHINAVSRELGWR